MALFILVFIYTGMITVKNTIAIFDRIFYNLDSKPWQGCVTFFDKNLSPYVVMIKKRLRKKLLTA